MIEIQEKWILHYWPTTHYYTCKTEHVGGLRQSPSIKKYTHSQRTKLINWALGLIWTSINFNPQCLTQLEHRSHLVIIFFSRLQHWTPHLWKLSACRSNTMKVAKTPTIVCQWTLTKHAQDISCTSIIIIGAICLIRRIIRVLSSRNRACRVLDLRYIVFNIINSKWLMICSRAVRCI